MNAPLPERLIAILARERRAGAENVRAVHALTVDERAEAGESVARLEVVSIAKDGVTLRCTEFTARFRAGDPLWLGDGADPERGVPVVFRDHDAETGVLRVDLDRGASSPPRLARDATLVLDRRELDYGERILGAVRGLFADAAHARCRDLFLGHADPEARAEAVAGPREAERAGLDPGQTEAFVAACTRTFALVQGPPGAGKTRLAASVVAAFARAGRRVLVSAFTHRAVNHLLATIARTEPGVAVAKIGPERQRDGLGAGVEHFASARSFRPRPGPGVAGITTAGAAGLLGPESGAFDLVLVDEAGQVSLAQACAVLPLGRRHVIVGDHRQLPPLVIAEHRDPLASRSLFEHLHDAYGSHLLTRTYRMNTALCAFPSAAFYGGRLEPAPEAAARALELQGDVGPLLAGEPAALIVPTRHRGARVVAPDEARMAAEIVARAIAHGLAPEEAAIIAPHRAQGNRIRAALRARLKDLELDRIPVVDTVERLQGGERDLIVLSLTASDPEAILAEAAFFFSPNRLNVSITRARKKLIVLASERLLDAFPDAPEPLRGADLLRRLWNALPRVEWPGPLP